MQIYKETPEVEALIRDVLNKLEFDTYNHFLTQHLAKSQTGGRQILTIGGKDHSRAIHVIFYVSQTLKRIYPLVWWIERKGEPRAGTTAKLDFYLQQIRKLEDGTP